MLNGKKVVAFICECNPFHEGHKRLINAAKINGDLIIAIMSGNFVQRGETAVYDKYYRAKKLLQNGVSLVIELPVEYTLSSAKYFATYSIGILHKLKFVDMLIFGSKINDINKLSEYANINLLSDMHNSNNLNTSLIHKYLKEGYSYSYTLSKVYNSALSSNDILAVEYIRAIKELKSKIMPICIKRENDIPTASKLRKSISTKITNDDFSAILNYKLLQARNNLINLSDTYLMTNDLYNSILKSSDKNLTFTKRAKVLKTKNRTLANIKRVLLNLILDIKKKDVRISNLNKKTNVCSKINYIRILGIKKSFLQYLTNIKIPYLLNYNNSNYKSFIKNFPNSSTIKSNKNGEFKLSPSIKINIFANELYNHFSKINQNEATTKALIL